MFWWVSPWKTCLQNLGEENKFNMAASPKLILLIFFCGSHHDNQPNLMLSRTGFGGLINNHNNKNLVGLELRSYFWVHESKFDKIRYANCLGRGFSAEWSKQDVGKAPELFAQHFNSLNSPLPEKVINLRTNLIHFPAWHTWRQMMSFRWTGTPVNIWWGATGGLRRGIKTHGCQSGVTRPAGYDWRPFQSAKSVGCQELKFGLRLRLFSWQRGAREISKRGRDDAKVAHRSS